MHSTYWLTAKENSGEVQRRLAENGFAIADMTRRSRQPGVWVTVSHEPEQAAHVRAIVTQADPHALVESSVVG